MSATIYYQPIKGIHVSVGAPSSFLKALAEAIIGPGAGGKYDFVLNASCVTTLYGLRAGLEATDQKEAITAILEAITQYGEIRVWAEY